MDNDNLLDSNISDEFVVTEAARTYLTEIARFYLSCGLSDHCPIYGFDYGSHHVRNR